MAWRPRCTVASTRQKSQSQLVHPTIPSSSPSQCQQSTQLKSSARATTLQTRTASMRSCAGRSILNLLRFCHAKGHRDLIVTGRFTTSAREVALSFQELFTKSGEVEGRFKRVIFAIPQDDGADINDGVSFYAFWEVSHRQAPCSLMRGGSTQKGSSDRRRSFHLSRGVLSHVDLKGLFF